MVCSMFLNLATPEICTRTVLRTISRNTRLTGISFHIQIHYAVLHHFLNGNCDSRYPYDS